AGRAGAAGRPRGAGGGRRGGAGGGRQAGGELRRGGGGAGGAAERSAPVAEGAGAEDSASPAADHGAPGHGRRLRGGRRHRRRRARPGIEDDAGHGEVDRHQGGQNVDQLVAEGGHAFLPYSTLVG